MRDRDDRREVGPVARQFEDGVRSARRDSDELEPEAGIGREASEPTRRHPLPAGGIDRA